MLIAPLSQNPLQSTPTPVAGAMTPSGVEQAAQRADIPPVQQPERDAPGQNQLTRREPAGTSQTDTSQAATGETSEPARDSASDSRTSADSAEKSNDPVALTEEEQVLLDQLRARDREVRAHEAAHAAVGGRYAGSASLDYTRGPDGRNYATGGEVSISTSPVAGDPQATIEKAQVIQAAALAPAEPSSQDRRGAAEAAQLELEARAELQAQQAEEAEQEQPEPAQDAEAEGRAENGEAASRQDAQAEEDAVPGSIAQGTNSDAETAAPGALAPPTNTPATGPQADAAGDTAEASPEAAPRDAREELEKILLGSSGLLQQANQQGLVDPQNPYGKSGYLDIIA